MNIRFVGGLLSAYYLSGKEVWKFYCTVTLLHFWKNENIIRWHATSVLAEMKTSIRVWILFFSFFIFFRLSDLSLILQHWFFPLNCCSLTVGDPDFCEQIFLFKKVISVYLHFFIYDSMSNYSITHLSATVVLGGSGFGKCTDGSMCWVLRFFFFIIIIRGYIDTGNNIATWYSQDRLKLRPKTTVIVGIFTKAKTNPTPTTFKPKPSLLCWRAPAKVVSRPRPECDT